MPIVTMKDLLEAGVHFGHQSQKWNPKMKPYIYSARNGIHVIDLHKTIPLIELAYKFIKETVQNNGTVLFVGTKKQAQEAVEEEAKRCGMFYISQRWLGGTLTNFKTLKKNIARLKEIEKWKTDGTYEKLPKKEIITIEREYAKLVRALGGIREMAALPTIVFIIDTQKEQTALKEARKLGIPIVAIVDTNTDPNEVNYPIPGNDDAIRSIKLLTKIAADAVVAAREVAQPVEGLPQEEAIAVPLDIEEEAEAISFEEKIEEMGFVKVPEEAAKEKRVGF
ncbi:MAG: 30S ribosomal protein S2 [Candidatus Margulisbacteria bacterium]|nr:30S ribosomal protein S2 [Candidatus Margulisiibacteriota bacterium]